MQLERDILKVEKNIHLEKTDIHEIEKQLKDIVKENEFLRQHN